MTAYRLLLLAFPRHVRREFGADMERMFDDQLRAAPTRAARLRVWSRAVGDAARHGFGERFGGPRSAPGRGPRKQEKGITAMQMLARDLRYARRLFLAQPLVTAIAIVTLAVGIGGTTAIFSAVDTLLLRPLPYDQPDELVMVWEKRPTEGVLQNVVAPADFADWERLNTVFTAMGAMMPLTVDLTGNGEPVRLQAGAVSTSFFDVLRITPAIGRTFIADEGMAGQHRVVVLGHALWRDRFGADRAAVGRKILLNGVPHEVVGVLPGSFVFADSSIQIWAPLPLRGLTQPPSRASHSLSVYARLRPGVTLADARTDMERVGALLSVEHPETNRTHGAWVTTLAEEVREPLRAGLWLLFGAVAFVLLIACVNVANLQLARAASRRREIAVRAAVGASRLRIIRQVLTESALLSVLGGAAGLVVAWWGIRLARGLTPDNVTVLGLEHIGLDPRVLAFAMTISIGTGLLFGTLPAWALAAQDASETLKSGGRTGGGIRRRLRVGLVVSEIALASLLLVGAGLTWRSFHALLTVDPGLTLEGRLTAVVALPQARYRGDQRLVVTFEEIERRFTTIAGVTAVGATSLLPLSGMDGRRGVGIEGREPDPDVPTRAHPRSVTPGYFAAMGMQLREGRLFSAADRADSPLVVVVNETMARRYWPEVSPVGRRIWLGGTTERREVIGVVKDVRHWGLDAPVNPEMYLPLPQMPSSFLTFAIATDGDATALAPAVREQLRAVDPDLPLSRVRTMKDVAARSLESRAVAMRLLGGFGLVALALAAAGIYGVMTHMVALRREEIGVRLTLGARPSDVRRMILREGAAQAAAGLALGLAGGVALMHTLRALLYAVSPTDPLTLGTVAIVLFATAVLACLLPARRAMRVDPAVALRQEA